MKPATAGRRSAKPAQSSATAPASIDVVACVQALERLLRAQLDGYTRLLVVIDRQREAIRTADPRGLDLAAREQETLVRTLSGIDGQRTQLLAALRRRVEARGATQAPTLTRMLDHPDVNDDQRQRVLALAADLRQRVQASQRSGGIVRDAANALARHMAGIQQTVHSALNRARLYERRGRLNLGSAVPATLDMKT
jgi:hypothetical protein